MEVVDWMPAYYDFHVSSDGSIWVNHRAHPDDVPVEEQPSRGAYGTRLWTVFDPDGRWLGTVRVPEGFRLAQVGPDWILGARTTSLGVPFIERYRILKP